MNTYTQSLMKTGSFQGKTILITGGGTGLGKAMGIYLSELGAEIIITGRRENVLAETALEIESKTGNPVFYVAGDVRKNEDVENTIQKSISRFGKIDGLINNAAGNFVSPTERLSHRAFESVIGIVLQGSINYTLAVGKYWIKEGIKGTILNITTTYAFTGTSFTVPSACAKAGVLALTRSLAVEWGKKYGIRVNAVSPGPFPTEGAWTRLIPEPLQDMVDPTKRVPLARVGEHQELANLVAYLMSDYAAYINGADINIDGGEWLMGAGMFNGYLGIPEKYWDMLDAMREKKS
jgi:NAD(P)-dependent dehydrogenase (short-subunit alcohol dehydrogenase family)